jgi:(S)-mandelate dehydrogenase
MRLARTASIEDLRRMAQRRMPGFAFINIDEGAGDDGGLVRNRRAFEERVFRIRRLRPLGADTKVEIFGRSYALPFGAAPVGTANLAWPGTDLALARLAEKENFPYVLSTAATTAIEKIAEAAPSVAWFQLYLSRDPAIAEDLMERARAAGVTVLVVTIDVPASPRRNRSIRGAVSIPFRFTPAVIADLALHPRWAIATLIAGNPQLENYRPYLKTANVRYAGRMMGQINKHGIVWDDIARVRERWQGKLVLKGVLDPEDAAKGIAAGADAIWVSNHGGRQHESSPATMDVIAGVRAAVGPGVPVFLDSGVRGGEDVVKAIALGATMAFCGRAFVYGAGARGAAGVERAFDLLKAETVSTMAQIGANAVSALGPDYILSPPPERAV